MIRRQISSLITMMPQKSGCYRFCPGKVSQIGWQGIMGEGHEEIQMSPGLLELFIGRGADVGP